MDTKLCAHTDINLKKKFLEDLQQNVPTRTGKNTQPKCNNNITLSNTNTKSGQRKPCFTGFSTPYPKPHISLLDALTRLLDKFTSPPYYLRV